jgi:hypothetical protein
MESEKEHYPYYKQILSENNITLYSQNCGTFITMRNPYVAKLNREVALIS